MPTKRQLAKMREAEMEYPKIRRSDDPMFNSNSSASADDKPLSKFISDKGVYMEQTVGQKWCFKFQPNGKPVIMCSHNDKETAAEMMLKELNLAGIDLVKTPAVGSGTR